MTAGKKINSAQTKEIIDLLCARFEKNKKRHENILWLNIEKKLLSNPDKLWSLSEMERTGGEPNLVHYNSENDTYTFYDCAPESPAGRRSLCYDGEALESRKVNKPIGSALDMAEEMGTELLDEKAYRWLQTLGKFDTKTSSWVLTPEPLRKLGGALFCDYRYGQVFLYHNGAESYYAARGFRTSLTI